MPKLLRSYYHAIRSPDWECSFGSACMYLRCAMCSSIGPHGIAPVMQVLIRGSAAPPGDTQNRALATSPNTTL
jgi:hypothetical protein